MTVKERLKLDLTAAMKQGDELRKSTLRGVLGTIQTSEKAGKVAVEFADEKVLEVLGQEVKKRRETAAVFAENGRGDRAERELAEAEVLTVYLPVQLTEAEVTAIVDAAVAQAGEGAALGQVMKLVVPQTKGKADGRMVSELVRARLS